MKRIVIFFAIAALLGQAAIVFAEDTDEPSIKSVLDAARAKYWQDKGSESRSIDTNTTENQDQAVAEDAPKAVDGASSARDTVPYTPALLSFVPGISVPFGYYNVALAAGAVGSLTRDVSGAEGSGVFNIARDVRGFQAAGVFNIARKTLGFQGAGVFNMVDGDISGFQGAGVFNMAHGEVLGFQCAGVFNMAGKVRGPMQGAGVFNMVDEIYGFQCAGVFNIAKTVYGGQMAGVFNKAGRVSGVQIGLVNVAENIDGVQLGLVNIAGNGVNSLGLTYEPASDFFYLHWQTGAPMLYTVIGLGAPSGDWFNDISGFVASYGLGTRMKLLMLNIDLDVDAELPIGDLDYESVHCSSRDRHDWTWEGWEDMKPYPTLRLMAGLPLGRHIQIVGGVKVDIDIDALGDRVPEALKQGGHWRGTMFNGGYTAYYKWFFGLKI